MVRQRDSLLGLRLGQGDAFEGELSMGMNYEYFYNDIFGFSGGVYHASYEAKLAVGPLEADVKTRALTFALQGNLHPTFVKVANLDPFVALGLAHTLVSAKTSVPGLVEAEAKTSRTFLVGSVNARYFLDPKLSVVGSLGFGLSTFTFGLDYRF